jgi:hypothetical protein
MDSGDLANIKQHITSTVKQQADALQSDIREIKSNSTAAAIELKRAEIKLDNIITQLTARLDGSDTNLSQKIEQANAIHNQKLENLTNQLLARITDMERKLDEIIRVSQNKQ